MRREYPNPPLREAVCEFIFQPRRPWDLANPGLIFSELRGQFPRRIQSPSQQPTLSVSVGFPLPGAPPSEPFPNAGQQELRFWREEDNNGVITVGPNRVSVSHYRPYPGWEDYREIIHQVFAAYLAVAEPDSIQRIGLRYINDIPLQAPFEPEDYFEYYPRVGPKLPVDYGPFRMSVDFPFYAENDNARVQLIALPGETNDSVVVRLDLDYSVVVPGSVDLSGTGIWLNGAHSIISNLFEGCLTDKARVLFRGEE